MPIKEELNLPTAKEHYSAGYHLQMVSHPENFWLYGYIAALKIRSVFEFGCNAGRHLYQLKRMGLKVNGIDVNERGIEAARLHHHLTLQVGDEKDLFRIPSESYDLVLTVSVLTHMEEVKSPLQELQRIARHHLILVETGSRTDKKNYWWRHDYPGRPVYSYYSRPVNSMYQIWHLQK